MSLLLKDLQLTVFLAVLQRVAGTCGGDRIVLTGLRRWSSFSGFAHMLLSGHRLDISC